MRTTDIVLCLVTVSAIVAVTDVGGALEIETQGIGDTTDTTVLATAQDGDRLVVIRDEDGTALGLGYALDGERADVLSVMTAIDRSDRKAYRMGAHALRNALAAREALRVRTLRARRHEGENLRRRLVAALAPANDDEIQAETAIAA